MLSTTLSGVGLHSGAPGKVRLTRCEGPTRIVQHGVSALLSELDVARTDYGVSVESAGGRLRVDLVEHLFAALSAMRALSSVQIGIEGPEVPLLDGGSGTWLDALADIGVREGTATHRVARSKRYWHGSSRYEFVPARGTSVEVTTEFEGALGTQRARFAGDLAEFRRDIAPARTFGFERDRTRLRNLGRARHVDLDAVLVFRDDGSLAHPTRKPFENEQAAHKLIDLVGDLLLYGALPEGALSAHRPGHTANHAVFSQALRDGVIAPLAHVRRRASRSSRAPAD